MADYWMKLYIEILDDPKMATLPDHLWRRIIELFLVAKKLNTDGHLPETKQLAWLLRMRTEDLDADLAEITPTGIVVPEGNGWYIPQFNKRQGASSSTERSIERRKREQRNQYNSNDNATDAQRFVAQSTEAESESETEADAETSDADNAWLPLSKAFTAATGIPELTGGPAAFYKAVEEMARAGVIPADITAAVGEMREKGFSIVSIRSVVNPAIIAMSRRTHPGNGRGRDAPKGWQDPDQPSPEEVLKLLESDS